MKSFASLTLSALALFAAAPAVAQSDCEAEFTDSAKTVIVQDIIVGGQDFTIERFDLRVRRADREQGTNNGVCRAALRIARLSTSPTPNDIAYTLQSRGQNLQILPNEQSPGTTRSDLLLPAIQNGNGGFNLNFQLGIPSGWGARSGAFVDDLIVLLVDEQGQILDTLPLTIVLDVPPAAEIRVVGATGNDAVARVDLGILDPDQVNQSDPFGVRVWSTSPYTVRFRSQNQGRLAHEDRRGLIPYRLFMNRHEVDVQGGVAEQVPEGTSALGDFHPMQILVEPFQARAGFYSDRVEVTVTAS